MSGVGSHESEGSNAKQASFQGQQVLRDEIKVGQLRLLARFKVSLAPC